MSPISTLTQVLTRVAVLGLLLACAATCRAAGPQPATADPSRTLYAPVYTAEGKLEFPAGYREWIFLSSGLDMSYSDTPGKEAHSKFDNVFVNPESHRDFQRTGTWADRTLFVLEVRGASRKGSINKHGKFQNTDLMAVEVHVKDTKRFPGGWAFYSFDGTEPAVRALPATQVPLTEDCYDCHRKSGAVDTTFVQFYPTLIGIATQKGTLAPGYRPQ